MDKIKALLVNEKKYICFSTLWVAYFLFLLNIYPGSLSVDSKAQLGQALGFIPYNNANPIINTLLLQIFVRPMGLTLWSTNHGIFLYSVFQLTLFAFVCTYFIGVICKKKYKTWIVICSFIWFIMPFNIMYAIGMWKDSFFAIAYFLLLIYLYDHSDKAINVKESVLLVLLSCVVALARNSGVIAIIVMLILLIPFTKKSVEYRNITLSLMIGIVLHFVILLFVYPLFAHGNTVPNSAIFNIPMQQIARTLNYSDKITEGDIEELDRYFDAENVKNNYNEGLVDPIRVFWDIDIINANKTEFLKLWMRIGIENPKCYFDGWVHHTKNYWDPFLCIKDWIYCFRKYGLPINDINRWRTSVKNYWEKKTYCWVFDSRIFENDYNVYREQKLFIGVDLGTICKYFSYFIPLLIFNAAWMFWIMLFGLIYNIYKKRIIYTLILLSSISTYLGLFFFCYAALNRYVYSAFIMFPLTICLIVNCRNNVEEETI